MLTTPGCRLSVVNRFKSHQYVSQILMLVLISQFPLRPAPPPPIRADPQALASFCLRWQIPGGGDS